MIRILIVLLYVVLLCDQASAQMRPEQMVTKPWLWTGMQAQPPCAPSTTTGTITLTLNACANPVNPSVGGSPDHWQFSLTGNGTLAVAANTMTVGQIFWLEVVAGGNTLSLPQPPFIFGSNTNTTFAGNSMLSCSVHDLTPTFWCPGGVVANIKANVPPALGAAVHGNASAASLAMPGLTSQGTSGVVVLFAAINPNTSITVTSPSLAWTQRASQTTADGNIEYEYTAPFTSALSGEVITLGTSGVTFITGDAFEVKNAPTSNFFDGASAFVASGTTNPSIVTTNASTMAICGIRGNATSPTAGTGWTLISGANFQLAQYQILSSPTTGLACAAGASPGANAASIGDAIK